MIRVTVFGANGRMGQTLCRLISESDDLELVGAVTERGHACAGRDAGEVAGLGSLGVPITDDVAAAVADCEVAIDFTLPAAAPAQIAACVDSNTALVIGTTGLSDEHQALLDDAGARIPVVYGRNMSVGVNVLTELTGLAARALGSGYDVEVSEAHHRHKVDAPSGTAVQLAESVARARDVNLGDVAVYNRHGVNDPRKPDSIGFTSVRAGTIVGDHSVLFAADEEIIELRHRALDRAVFARGALRAASWLVDQPVGLYSMSDVLGLDGR